ncbi:MAG: Cof-type HAD-IIB family hydrolase [Clostridiaceae bacterium]|jgi:Cof subfamily protein (haloacid dehalogenase superfamily)|nr:Cof-type HAD-IIB family hydrolase [Clostridiaceae bacterium]
MALKLPIKMLVLDLDGTLLDDNKVISERSKRALSQLKEKGVCIVFASGRTNFMMELYREPYVVCDYHISFNGAMTEDLAKREILDHVSLDSESCGFIWDFLAEKAAAYTAYSENMMFYKEQNNKLISKKMDKYVSLAASENIIINPARTELNSGETVKGGDNQILKFVAYEEDPLWINQFETFLGELDQVRSEATGYGLTGVFDVNVSKERAIRKLCDRLEISDTEVCAIGDYDNDLNMFNVSGVKVAMRNATKDLKKHADYICPTNNEDGVACFIEEYII